MPCAKLCSWQNLLSFSANKVLHNCGVDDDSSLGDDDNGGIGDGNSSGNNGSDDVVEDDVILYITKSMKWKWWLRRLL